jgi:hypothetical protein
LFLFNVYTSNVPLVQEPDTDEPAVENCTVDECAAEEADTTITMDKEKEHLFYTENGLPTSLCVKEVCRSEKVTM